MSSPSFKIGLLLAALTALGSAACTGEADELTNGRGKKNKPGSTEGAPCEKDDQCQSGKCDLVEKVCLSSDSIASALQCNAKPQGVRSYALFDGSKLEATRANEDTGVNRARVKPFAVMADEYKRVLGAAPPSLEGAGASFAAPPARWHNEPSYSGVSMNKIYEISFEGCLTYARGKTELAAAPTKESATTECTSLMKKAWNTAATPEEIKSCADLATDKLSGETDPARRWAYACASVLSSSHFLTF